jgi:phospholipid/cholesterol/gamma-HCH transport system substrate-binding protein
MNEAPDILHPLPPDEPKKERFKFRRVNEITGVFVLVIVAALVAAVVWADRSQRWFKSNVTLRIVLPENGAAGIRQGSEVYFLGTLVGSVSDVIVAPTGRMEAQTHIRHDFFRFVRADSSAVVKKKFGVAGDSFFEITRGVGEPLLEVNASIVCNEQFQNALESAIEEIRRETLLVLKKTSTGLDTWTKLGADLVETRKHLDQLTIRMENMAAGIEAGKGTVGKLITDTAVVDDAQVLLARANATMTEFQSMLTNLNVAVKNVEKGTVRLPEISDSVADDAKSVAELILQSQTSMREFQRLTEAAQHHWLLRRYVNQTNPPSSHLPEPDQSQQQPVKILAVPATPRTNPSRR